MNQSKQNNYKPAQLSSSRSHVPSTFTLMLLDVVGFLFCGIWGTTSPRVISDHSRVYIREGIQAMTAAANPFNKMVCVLLVCCLVTNCKLAKLTCKNYQQINKENIRNCLAEMLKRSSLRKTALKSFEDIPSSTAAVDFENQVSDVSDKFSGSQSVRNLTSNGVREIDFVKDLICLFNVNMRTGDNMLEVHLTGPPTEARKMMSSRFANIIPFLVLPGLVMAGILPWVLPGLNLIVSFATMMNQMAFSSSLFSLVRSYIFDTRQEEHVVYVNHGYKNHHTKD